MTTQTDYDIVGSYNNQRVTSIDGERSINLFEYKDMRGKKGKTLLPTSGITSGIFPPSAPFPFLATSGGSPNLVLGTGTTANWQLGTPVIFSVNTMEGGALPAPNPPFLPLIPGQVYYVSSVVNTTTFTVSVINGGTPITFFTTGTAPITVMQSVDIPLLFPGAANGFRGHFIFGNGNNYMQYVVIGRNVYSISPALTVVHLNHALPLLFTAGYVAIDANQASTPEIFFTENNSAVSPTPNGAGYIYNTTTGAFVLITDPDFPGNTNNPGYPVDATFLDGFFVTGNGINNTFLLSSINEGLIWGPDFTTGTGNAFTGAITSSNIVLTTGTSANYQVGTPVVFSAAAGSTLPGGLVAGTTYYVVSSVIPGTTFTVSATPGGTAIVFSSSSTGTPTVTNNGQLQQGAITSHPGTIVACRTLHRRLFLFSQNFTEVWLNQGIGANLPFRRENSLLMEYGCPAIASIRVGFDKMFFMSQDKDGLGAVMMVDGAQAIPISTRALDFALAGYAANQQASDAWGILIKENGLIFYRLNFTLANHTYVYNVTLSNPLAPEDEGKMWHEEQTLGGNRHVAQTHGYFNGVNYYGHYSLPILYIVNSTLLTNDGEAIERIRIPRPIVPPGYQRLRIDRMHIDLVQGVVADDATNINPIVYLSISKDGGQSFGNRIKANMGQLGQRSFRTVWRKLGTIPRGQAFVCKIEFYNPVPFVVLGAAWCVDQLPE